MAKLAGGSWLPKAIRLAIYVRDGFACCYCGRDLRNAQPREASIDHLLPRSTGGTHEPENLVTACLSCNSSRGAKPWVDYATGGARDRIEQLRRQPLNLALARALIAGTAGDPATEALRA